MATFVWTNANVVINSVDESDHVSQVQLNYNAEMLDATVMATAATRIRRPGLFDWSVDITLFDDFADADLDDLLFALVGAAAFPIILRPTQAVIGATNPEFRGNVVLEGDPVGGSVGEMAAKTLTFQSAGVLTRNDA